MEFKSSEELYFSWWLNELKDADIITDWKYEPETIELCQRIKYQKEEIVVKRKKKVVKVSEDKLLLHGISYTCDFVISWNKEFALFESANLSLMPVLKFQNDKKIMYETPFGLLMSDNFKSYVDVKGSFSGKNNNSAITFPLKQKMLWDKEGIYAQKIIPVAGAKSLFNSTFIPERYYLTDTGEKPRARRVGVSYVQLKNIPKLKSFCDFIIELRKKISDNKVDVIINVNEISEKQ